MQYQTRQYSGPSLEWVAPWWRPGGGLKGSAAKAIKFLTVVDFEETQGVRFGVCLRSWSTGFEEGDWMREEHGAYWFVVECLAAGPQSVREWKVYVNPGGRVEGRIWTFRR